MAIPSFERSQSPPARLRENPAQAAALLDAEGREDRAVELLSLAVATDAAHLGPEAWHMLFELFRFRGMAREFRGLATSFEAVFLRPAPPWIGPVARRLAADLLPGGACFLELPEALDQGVDAALEQLSGAVQGLGALHLDLSQIRQAHPEGAAGLARHLRGFMSRSVAIRLTGWETLATRLEAAIARPRVAPGPCALLLTLYQLHGRRADFERVALIEALLAGNEPPAWEPTLLPVFPLRPIGEQRQEPRYLGRPDQISLRGVIALPADEQLDLLETFEDSHPWANIDLSGLRRMDLTCTRRFLDRVNGLAQRGTTVRLLNCTQLFRTLLSTRGLHPVVVVPWPPEMKPVGG